MPHSPQQTREANAERYREYQQQLYHLRQYAFDYEDFVLVAECDHALDRIRNRPRVPAKEPS